MSRIPGRMVQHKLLVLVWVSLTYEYSQIYANKRFIMQCNAMSSLPSTLTKQSEIKIIQ